MAFLSMTRMRIKSLWLLPKVMAENLRIINQLRVSKGFKTGKVLVDPSLGMWSISLWEDEQTMQDFFVSGTHRISMPKIVFYADEAATAHIDFEETQPPDWDFVHHKLSTIGNFTIQLQTPSQDQLNKIIKKPSTTLFSFPIYPVKKERVG